MKKVLCCLLVVLCVLLALPVAAETPDTPVILSQPPSFSGAMGGLHRPLRVEALSPDGGTLEYQWYRGEEFDGSDKRPISGATAPVYDPPMLLETVYYCVGITNVSDSGERSETVFSAMAEVSFYELTEEYTMNILSLPDKTVYSPGETIDLNGLILTIESEDFSLRSEDGMYLIYSEEPLTVQGEQTFFVGYENAKVGFSIRVEPSGLQVTGLSVERLPEKTEYEVGERPDLLGLTVAIHMDSETMLSQDGEMLTVFPEVLDQPGEQRILLEYEGFMTDFTVFVREPPTSSEEEETSRPGSDTTATGTAGNTSETSEGTTDPGEGRIDVETPDNTWIFWVIGGICLLVIIVLAVSSRNDRKSAAKKTNSKKKKENGKKS